MDPYSTLIAAMPFDIAITIGACPASPPADEEHSAALQLLRHVGRQQAARWRRSYGKAIGRIRFAAAPFQRRIRGPTRRRAPHSTGRRATPTSGASPPSGDGDDGGDGDGDGPGDRQGAALALNWMAGVAS